MRKVWVSVKCGTGKAGRGYLLDISKGGAAVAVSRRIRKDTAVELILKKESLSIKSGDISGRDKRKVLLIKDILKNKKSFLLGGIVVSALKRAKKVYNYKVCVKFVPALAGRLC